MVEPKETWRQWVALTIILLALAAAISASKWTGYFTRLAVFTTQKADQSTSSQARGLLKRSYQLNRDILNGVRLMEGKSPQAQRFLGAKIKEYDSEMARLGNEEAQSKTEAEERLKQEDSFRKKTGDFALAALFLQIAITVSAAGLLTKKKLPWYVGLVLGIWGLGYMVKGFLF